MAAVRALSCAAVVAASLAVPAIAAAASDAACAQRVIRDWYAEGRVDSVHPLGCYRAAIRSLPEDVVQYSDAREQILRALAYARQGLPGPAESSAESSGRRSPPTPSTASSAAPPTRSDLQPPSPSRKAKSAPATGLRAFDGPVHLAADDVEAADAQGVPYPILALAMLAALLLAAAAAARLGSRRRGSGGASDR